ncbi:MAG: lasso RiPP family leader peptide-containing protein [Gemmatimonadetes bacterium]|nr:lasso RiPP family leader peptide-containing protein [Gemmatimonadota bacterium]
MNAPSRRAYVAPRLQVYGTVRELTLTATTQHFNRNDSLQGGNNLKT